VYDGNMVWKLEALAVSAVRVMMTGGKYGDCGGRDVTMASGGGVISWTSG